MWLLLVGAVVKVDMLHALQGIPRYNSITATSRSVVRSLSKAYKIIYEGACRKEVPIALVVTGLEKEDVMHSWWMNNTSLLEEHRLVFNTHACVTTANDNRQTRIHFDQHALRTFATGDLDGMLES
ncbi:hypothetical protein V8B97DRAFT_1921148 [Scleroderma yunnanense]